MDKDTSNAKLLREDPRTAGIPIYHDPGHIKTGVLKKLTKIIVEALLVKGISGRFAARFMALIKLCEALHEDDVVLMAAWFEQEAAFLLSHYTHGACAPRCGQGKCPYRGADGAELKRRSEKNFFDPKVHADKIALIESYLSEVIATRHEYIHGYRTTIVESTHSQRTW